MQLEQLGNEEVNLQELGFNEDELKAISEQHDSPVTPTNPEDVGDYDESSDSYQVRIDGVAPAHKESVLALLNQALAEGGHENLRAEAY